MKSPLGFCAWLTLMLGLMHFLFAAIVPEPRDFVDGAQYMFLSICFARLRRLFPEED